MLPAEVYRLLNWLRLMATKSNMIVPNEVANPSCRAGGAEHQRHDQRRRHARGNQRDRLRQNLPKVQRIGFQLVCVFLTVSA